MGSYPRKQGARKPPRARASVVDWLQTATASCSKARQLTKQALGLRERNRIRTRDEILVAMSLLLGSRSYESLTVDDVAHQAGVSRGTIYTYFPEGRDQLLRDAYQRIAEKVTAEGTQKRAELTQTTDRIIALARSLAETSATAEGRFYGLIGSALFGPLGGVTGAASESVRGHLREDLSAAAAEGTLAQGLNVDDAVVLFSGAIREIGHTAARAPERVPALLDGLRALCHAVLVTTK